MMKKILLSLLLLFPFNEIDMSFYDFDLKTISGESFDLNSLKGKKVLIVNVASRCGYTPQYEDLQNLHEQFGDKIAVLGFPANNFGGQEPGTNEDIAEFCQANYGVSFPMFEKISVKGSDKHPLYEWLEAQSGESPSWNFCKYLLNEKGEVLGFYPSAVNPLDEKITGQL